MAEDIQISTWEVRRSEVVAEQAVVTAKHPAVARIGVDILKKGGNAIDAAVAMSFATGVAEPHMNGIGGGGFMTVALANGESYVVDYFPRAPLAATENYYELTDQFRKDKLGFTGVKNNANAVGHRAVGIPGGVAGPLLAVERWGRLARSIVMTPAIALARDGIELTWRETLTSAAFFTLLKRHPETARVFLDNGNPLVPPNEAGKLAYFCQPELANTLESIQSEGAEAFYQGEIATKIVAELQSGGHPVTMADFANYQALVKEPLKTAYQGLDLLLLPGASGGPTVAEIIHILGRWDLAARGHNSAAYLHLVIEACKLALADRLAFMGEQVDGGAYIPWRELASSEYAAERRRLIGTKAANEYNPGNPLGVKTSVNYRPNSETCTTFLSAWDKEGNVVAITQTHGAGYGSGVTVPGIGVLLNNLMVLFDPRPGQANSVGAGKRPTSSMSHFIALKSENGIAQPYCLAGAPGGRKIVDTVTQVLLNMLDFGMRPQAACGSPFIDPTDEVTIVDELVGEATISGLREFGHKINPQRSTYLPRLSANPSATKRQGGLLYGGIDLYSAGAAAGY